MAYPFIYANLTAGDQPLNKLDANFAALGVIVMIPCTASGTNTVTLVPVSGCPTVAAYNQMQGFIFVATATSTGGVTIQVSDTSALGFFGAYKASASGPTAIGSGDIVLGELYLAFWDQALAGGSGGFHVINIASSSGGGNATVNNVTLWNYFI